MCKPTLSLKKIKIQNLETQYILIAYKMLNKYLVRSKEAHWLKLAQYM